VEAAGLEFEFTGELTYWRGPAPWHFVNVPDDRCGAIEAASSEVSYGWGCIPATAVIGDTTFTTSLFPKDGAYLVPVKTAVRKAEQLELGDVVTVRLRV
jgi:Domain of unknown function (DUF1905)